LKEKAAMRQRFVGMTIVLTLAFSCSANAADEKKTNGGTPQDPNTIDADKLAPGRFAGKLLSVPGSNSTFTVEVPYDRIEMKSPGQTVNQAVTNAVNNFNRDLARIAPLQAQVQQARNPKAYQQAMQQLQNAISQAERSLASAQQAAQNPNNSPFKVVHEKKKVDFHTGDEVMVRFLHLPLEYDDKGHPKKFTAEEAKKLKGSNPSLPGYEAKLEDLQTGGVVLIALGLTANKPPPAKKDPEKKEPEKKEPEKTEPENKDTHRTVVKLILIINNPTNNVVGSMAPEKKGKQPAPQQ
jgi:hypothetical protein